MQAETTSSSSIFSRDLWPRILTQLRRSSKSASIFLPILRVCTQWRDGAAPLLYSHIFIRLERVRLLFECARKEGRQSIISLSFVILKGYFRAGFGSFASIALYSLEQAAPNSTTFPYTMKRYQNSLQKRDISMIIDGLPQTCANLEIDPFYEQNLDIISHICECLRLCLPRMRNIRLRLSIM